MLDDILPRDQLHELGFFAHVLLQLGKKIHCSPTSPLSTCVRTSIAAAEYRGLSYDFLQHHKSQKHHNLDDSEYNLASSFVINFQTISVIDIHQVQTLRKARNACAGSTMSTAVR
jgi:hypothetical protein